MTDNKVTVNHFIELCKHLSEQEYSKEICDSTEQSNKKKKKSRFDQYPKDINLRPTNKTDNSYLNNQAAQVRNVISNELVKLFPVSSGTKHRPFEITQQLDHKVFVDTPCEQKITDVDDPTVKDLNSQILGKFSVKNDAKLLTPEELEGESKAWARRDMFKMAAPITNSKGKRLLEKMGWKEGDRLGKSQSGPLVPIELDVKCDRSGLVSDFEKNAKRANFGGGGGEGKHPVSFLLELCQSSRWPEPLYEIVKVDGPPHKPNFLMRVTVNDISYQPNVSSASKKLAKAHAAIICLETLGFTKSNFLKNV